MTDRLSGLIGGVIPPICTPLTADGRVDTHSLLRLRDWLLGSGVKGIFALGSTGEASYLRDAARREVVEALSTCDAEQPVPLLVGVVDTTAQRITDAFAAVRTSQVAAAVVTGPFYARASDAEITRHFEFVSSHCGVPVLAYNIPVNVGYSLPVTIMHDLLSRGVIVGIKDSSPDLAALRELIAGLPAHDDLLLCTGSDALLDCALLVGANAAVAGLANVAPDLFVTAVAAHRSGDPGTLARVQQTITSLTRLYISTEQGSGLNSTQLGSIKSALMFRGLIQDDLVSTPMNRTSPERRTYVRSVLAECGLLDTSSP